MTAAGQDGRLEVTSPAVAVKVCDSSIEVRMVSSEPLRVCRVCPPRKVAMAIGLVLLIGLGHLVIKMPGVRRQARAVATVRQLGGWVFYDCRYQPNGEMADARPPGPGWLHNLLGMDFFGTVTGVKLTEVGQLEGLGDFEFLSRPCPKVSDASLALLCEFSDLEWLALNRAKITDAGLKNLRNLVHLERLWLDDTEVGDAGLAHLQGLHALTTLSLRGTRTSNAGLLSLKPLIHLRRLRVERTQCTLSGILHLLITLQGRSLADALDVAGFAKRDQQGRVIALNLALTHVEDEDLAKLDALGQLQWLYLNGTAITNAGLIRLKPLANLELLHLGETAVTDAGLEHLHGLTRLRTLHLTGTRVTDEGVKRFQETMPNTLRIYR